VAELIGKILEKMTKLSTKMGFRRKFMKISKSNPFQSHNLSVMQSCTTMTLLLTQFPHEMLQKIIVFAGGDA
jgi:hypothetical protein